MLNIFIDSHPAGWYTEPKLSVLKKSKAHIVNGRLMRRNENDEAKA